MSLLLEMAREAVLAKVAQRVGRLSREYVEGWVRGEFSLVDRVAERHGTEIRAWKDVVVETMRALTVEDLLDVCRATRPDFADLWDTDGARDRLAGEWSRAQEYVKGL